MTPPGVSISVARPAHKQKVGARWSWGDTLGGGEGGAVAGARGEGVLPPGVSISSVAHSTRELKVGARWSYLHTEEFLTDDILASSLREGTDCDMELNVRC